MSLRTYQLITHPAYLRYVERSLFGEIGLAPADIDAPHIPRIEKIYDIAEYLKISPNTIRFLLINTPKYYRTFSLTKRSGGLRTISAPRLFMKVVQWWIYDAILSCVELDDCVHGFVRGRSYITNASRHIGARHVLNVDIENCFDSVNTKFVENVFCRFGYSESVSLQLAGLCCLHGSLPQGAPTSPMLLNLILQNFDAKLKSLCVEEGIVYTRYADDLTFSSKDRIPENLINSVSEYLFQFNLKLNSKKTRFMGPNDRKDVTGLILGNGRVNLPPEFLNALRGWIHRLSQNHDLAIQQEGRLRGTIALLESVGGVKSQELSKRGRAVLHAVWAARTIGLNPGPSAT